MFYLSSLHYRNYHTNFNLDTIKQAIKDVACSAGIEHRGWYNPGSTWYGPARRVRHMARLTVALNKFGRAAMFGPGTACRCASCNKLPKTCEWGGGPYAGTMLLYLQEIAVNKWVLNILTSESCVSDGAIEAAFKKCLVLVLASIYSAVAG